MPAPIVLTGSARVPDAVSLPVGATYTASHGSPPQLVSLSCPAGASAAPASGDPELPCAHAATTASQSGTNLIRVSVTERARSAMGNRSRPARRVDGRRIATDTLDVHRPRPVGEEPPLVV